MTSGKYHVDAATEYARQARFEIRISPLTVAGANSKGVRGAQRSDSGNHTHTYTHLN